MSGEPRIRRFRLNQRFVIDPLLSDQTPEPDYQPESQTVRQARKIPGVYVISVASRLLEMHPQTLRKYERIGLIRPSRSEGMLRLYSEDDINRLRMIKYLVEERGMNLAGVEMALEMLTHLIPLREMLPLLIHSRAERLIRDRLESLLSILHFPAQNRRQGKGIG